MKESRKNPHLRLSGNRISLRYPEGEDFIEFSDLALASKAFHKGLASPPFEKEAFEEYIAGNEIEANERLLICAKADGAILGAINLSQIFRKAFQNAYLGYYLFEEAAGNGFMTEAVSLTLRFAFKDLKLHRIEANVQPENLKSIAVLKRCGFTKEGFSRRYLKIGGKWRDHERWAMIAEDWKKLKKND